jgi:hypothetical protein
MIDTDLDAVEFAGNSYGMGADAQPDGQHWVTGKVENEKFIGDRGPQKL